MALLNLKSCLNIRKAAVTFEKNATSQLRGVEWRRKFLTHGKDKMSEPSGALLWPGRTWLARNWYLPVAITQSEHKYPGCVPTCCYRCWWGRTCRVLFLFL